MYAGVGFGGRFRKVPKGWFRKVSEDSGGFWKVRPRDRVWKVSEVPEAGQGSKVPKSSGVVCCLATLTGAAA